MEENNPSKKKKSLMWEHVEKIGNLGQQIRCKICKREYKYCNNTSNMRDHLFRKHPETLADLAQNNDANEVERSVCQQPSSTKYNTNSTRKKMLDSLFVKMIAVDMEPLRLAEREGLKEFVSALDSRYQMPGRTDAATKLNKFYMKMKIKLIEVIGGIRYMAITADTWKSKSNQGILGLTSHFIKENRLVSALLAARVIEGHHNADNIASVIASILDEFDCREKVVVIVTDNAAVMIKVAENLKMRHVPCFAHTLNLIIKDALLNCNQLKAIDDKCKAIVTYYKNSTLASDKLKQIQRDLNKKELKLIQHVDTRWNSSLHMISRIKLIRDELTLALNQNLNAPPNLTAEEYGALEELEKIFEPIEAATEAISGEEYASLSLTIPLIKGMSLRFVELEKELTSDFAHEVLENLKTSLITKLKPYEKRTPCILSTLLNPHFKKMGFKTDADIDRAIQCLQREYTSHLSMLWSSASRSTDDSNNLETSSEDTEVPTKKSKRTNLLSFLQESQPTIQNPTVDSIVDIRQYVEKPVLPRTYYPIEYWVHSQGNLKQVALKYLCVPGSSTPAERIFSKAGQVVTERRNRLSPSHIDEILFINQNHKIFK